MTKWIPIAVTILLALVGALTPQINAYVAAHPAAAMVIAGVYAVLKGLMPSPVDPRA